MQNKTLIFFIILLVFFISSCSMTAIRPSGNVTKIIVPISDFTGIHIGNGIQLFATKDSFEKIEIEADDNIQELFTSQKIGDNLDIRLNRNANFTRRKTMKVYISYKNILELNATSGCIIKFTNTLNTPDFSIKLSDGSLLKSAINCTNLNAEITGGSKATLTGTANYFNLNATDGCQVNDFGFVSKKLNCKISAGTVVNTTIKDKLDVVATDGSILNYKGNATINSQTVNTGGHLNNLK
jgi:Putative auto-transporter adhesin, head GIN domain